MASPRDQLLRVLQEASSQQPERLKLAESQLKEWDTSPNFYALLQDIFYDKYLEIEIRWIAGIYLKNGIDKYWRKTAKNAIGSDERNQIRSRLLTLLDEKRKELAVQNAVLTSKIARFDFPLEWPDLLQNILGILQSTLTSANADTTLIQHRTLYILHLVIKALCSKTLAPNRRSLEQASPELFRNIAAIYVAYSDSFVQKMTHNVGEDLILLDMETSLLALKCLRRLIVYGFQEFDKVEDTVKFFSLSGAHIQKFYELRISFFTHNNTVVSFLSTHIIQFGKLYMDLQKLHPISFVLCPSSMDILQFYWRVLESEGQRLTVERETSQPLSPPLFEKFLIQGMILLKNTIKNYAYTIDKQMPDAERTQIVQARFIIDNTFLTPTLVNSCAEVLITRYMMMRAQDFELWQQDPEQWVGNEEADHWEYDLRRCAEKVFTDLMSQNRQQLSPVLVNLVENVAALSDSRGVLFKDAVYCAIGLAAHDLFETLDFDALLNNRLIHEAWSPDPSFKVIRRRIVWLIGKWIGVKISKDYRPQVYKIMLHLMAHDEDLVVRLSAANNLKQCVDDWDFEPQVFAPFLEESVNILTAMLGEVEEFDSRMRILNCLSMIIERMEDQIAPFANRIVHYLPSLWQASESEHLFKSAILATLTKLIGSLREQSINFLSFVTPMIKYSVDRNQDAFIYLMEDGLDLWFITLQCSTQCFSELFELLPMAIELLEYGTETLKKVLKIIEGYALLAPEQSMQAYANAIMDAFSRMLGNLRPQASNAIIHVFDTILQATPFQLICEPMMNTGLLWKLLSSILERKEPGWVTVHYTTVIARIIIYDQSFFLNVINIIGQGLVPTQPNLLGIFLDTWFDNFDSITHSQQRKLSCMALTAMISTNNPIILERLGLTMNVWSDVLSEVKESGDGDAPIYWEEIRDVDDDIEQLEGTPQSRRKKELLQRDPIHTTNLLSFIHLKLKECESLNGGHEAFQQNWLSRVDSALLDQLSTLL